MVAEELRPKTVFDSLQKTFSKNLNNLKRMLGMDYEKSSIEKLYELRKEHQQLENEILESSAEYEEFLKREEEIRLRLDSLNPKLDNNSETSPPQKFGLD